MAKRAIVGAVAGGLIAYLWGAVSWMVLPWHTATLRTFTNEITVANVVRRNAPKAGVYLLSPYHWKNLTPEQKTVPKGFMLFGVVRHSSPAMPLYYLRGLFISIVAAFLIGCLLMQVPGTFTARVGFVALLALTAGVLTRLPDWNWWSFSSGFAIMALVDLVVGWTLAALAMARLIPAAKGGA